MGTKLYLIRHGKTEGSEANRCKGHIDVPLSEKGIQQMKRLSAFIGEEISAIYCSDLIRAVKSAEIIAKSYSLKPVVEKALRERNFGIWEGMSFDEIKDKYPEEFKAWASNPLKFSPLHGESTIEVYKRAVKALDEILRNHDGKNIAIVSHGGINRIVLCHFLGVPLENIFRIEQDFSALNIIEFYDSYPVVKLINFNAQNSDFIR
jgi:alpha-ribazole phosphatase/probable phosphoglycerate mutase